MELYNRKIFRPGLIITLLLIFSLFSVSFSIKAKKSPLLKGTLKNFITPKYNEKTNKLEYILSGKNAESVGSFIKIDDVRLEIIGEDGKSVEAIIETPEAYYDRAADFVKGDKKIKFKSLQFDAKGVGFSISQNTEKIHIRNDVKLILKEQAAQKEKSKLKTKNMTEKKDKKFFKRQEKQIKDIDKEFKKEESSNNSKAGKI